MQIRFTLSLATIAAVSMAGPAMAQHPNLTGTWSIDTALSAKSQMTPASSTYIIVQHGDTLTVDRSNTSAPSTTMPEPMTLKSKLVWAVDGQPWKNTLPLVGAEVETTTTSTWAGDTMLVHVTGQVQGNDLVQDDRWSLSADGKTLTIHRGVTYAGQAMGAPTLVYVKQ